MFTVRNFLKCVVTNHTRYKLWSKLQIDLLSYEGSILVPIKLPLTYIKTMLLNIKFHSRTCSSLLNCESVYMYVCWIVNYPGFSLDLATFILWDIRLLRLWYERPEGHLGSSQCHWDMMANLPHVEGHLNPQTHKWQMAPTYDL